MSSSAAKRHAADTRRRLAHAILTGP